MNPHLEAFARALGIFLSIYFTSTWASNSPPVYDTWLVVSAIIAALVLAHA